MADEQDNSDGRFHRLRSAGGFVSDWARTKREQWKVTRHRLQQQLETPDSYAEGHGRIGEASFSDRRAERDQLQTYHDIRVDGGIIASLLEARGLMVFGVGAEFTAEQDAVSEWLNDQFEELELTALDVGTDALFYGYSLAEIRETVEGEFGKLELIEPWTTVPKRNNTGEIDEWEQVVKRHRGRKQTQTFDPDEIYHFSVSKSSGRDNVGMSMLGRAMSEATAYRENQDAIQNAVTLHSFPKWHIKLGREDGAVIDDNELRRARPKFDGIDELTKWVTGQDVDIETIQPDDFDFQEITEHDLSKLAIAFMLPVEISQLGGGDGLGTGFPARLRERMFLLSANAQQRALAGKFQQLGKDLLREYAPPDIQALAGDIDEFDLRFEFGDPITDMDELQAKVSAVGQDMTVNERRDMFDLPPLDDDEVGESYQSAAQATQSEGEDGGEEEGMFFRRMELQEEIPDEAVSYDDSSEVPEGATTITGPRGGDYYIPEGASDGQDGADVDGTLPDPTDESSNGSMIAETPEDLPDAMNPNNASEVEDFESGRTGQDEDMQIARMPDSPDLLVKPNPVSGEADASAAAALNSLSNSAPDTAYVESDDVLVQSLEGEGSVTEIPANQDSYTETFASTVAIGDADPNSGNFIVDDDGNVANVDAEAIDDISQEWVQDAIRQQVEDQYADMGYRDVDEAIDAINEELQSQIEDINVDKLKEDMPDVDVSNQIVENIEYLKNNDVQLQADGFKWVKLDDDNIESILIQSVDGNQLKLQEGNLSATMIEWIRTYAGESGGSLDDSIESLAEWLDQFADEPATASRRLREGVVVFANAQGVDMQEASQQPVQRLLTYYAENRNLAEATEDGIDMEALLAEIQAYRSGFESIVWADLEHDLAAGPTFGNDDDVPANVRNRLEEASRFVEWADTEGVPPGNLREFFVRKLSQPNGWSIDSLANGLRSEFGARLGEPSERENIARTKSAALLNQAKRLAFEDLQEGIDEQLLYYWDGPQDDATTDACEELKELTNPEHGGTPRPRDEFDSMMAEVRNEYFPDFTSSGDAIHFNERHALDAVLPEQVDVDPAGVGGMATAPGDD